MSSKIIYTCALKRNPVYTINIFFFGILFLISVSCGQNDTEGADKNNQTSEMQLNKIDACSVITPAELGSIINGEVKNTDDKAVFLDANEFYHYISLCNFYHADNVMTIRIAQKKKSIDPIKSRDSYYSIQKEDENITLIEKADVNGTPAIYFDMHEKEFDIKMNTLILFTGEFEVSVISDFMSKDKLVKAAEKILGRIK